MWPSRALLAFVLATANVTAFAADTLPLGNIDAFSPGVAVSANAPDNGAMAGALVVGGGESSVDTEDLQLSGEERELLRDAGRASVIFGIALTRTVSFSLGLHGTHEVAGDPDRDALFAAAGDANDDYDWRTGQTDSAFAGASLMARINLVQTPEWQLALAPFLETGSGETASYALTRSVGPKAGWMVLGSYGARGVARLTVNGGYRYRNPETLGEFILRNEVFGKAQLDVYLSQHFAVLAALEGRQQKVARADERDSNGKRVYMPRDNGAASLGFSAHLDGAQLAAFGGKRLAQGNGFGFGQAVFGASVSFALGNTRGKRPQRSFAREIEERRQRQAAQKPAKKPPPPAEEEIDWEELAKPIDHTEALGPQSDDDFSKIDKAVAEREKFKGPSADEKVSQELEQLRAAEVQAEATRKAQEEVEAEARRAEARARAKEDAELMRRWTQEAEDEIKTLPQISDEEMEWRGLED